MDHWIVVRNWEKFQHYKDRRPVWIKTYTEITSLDEYRALSLAARGALQGIWVEYSNAQGVIKQGADLSARLGQHVSKQHLTSLVQAGFIEIVAIKPPKLEASPEKEKRREETPLPPSGLASKSKNGNDGEDKVPGGAQGRPLSKPFDGEEFIRKSGYLWLAEDITAELAANGVLEEERKRLLALAESLRPA